MTKPPSSDQPGASTNHADNFGLLALLFGGCGVVFLLFGVQQTSVFGETCYHLGDVSMNTVCLHRELYLGGWVVSIGLLFFGALQMIRSAAQGPRA
ncbi:MAG: hypothetical protein ACE360_04040 [Hyphomicrobiales bacterium]